MNFSTQQNLVLRARFLHRIIAITGLCISLLISGSSEAQTTSKTASDTVRRPTFYLGVAGAANFNFYDGYISALNADVNLNPAFEDGNGAGGYLAGVIEYHPRNRIWGLMLQQGADNRRGVFKENGTRLEAKISYLTIEPSFLVKLKVIPLYIYAGPRLGLLMYSRFTVRVPGQPEYPQRNVNPDAYIKNLDKTIAGLQVGVGYNLTVMTSENGHPLVVSPFVTYLPSLEQDLRTIEELKVNTIRAGIILKTGRGLRPLKPVPAATQPTTSSKF